MHSLDICISHSTYISSNVIQPIVAPERHWSLLELTHRLPHNYIIGFITITRGAKREGTVIVLKPDVC